MTTSPYMPLYIADYLTDAAHLTTEEHGAYLLLIMTYWQRGKPLPANSNRLALIARMTSERWTDVERTLNEFFTLADGKWHHKRIDEELSKYREKSEKAKLAGKASAAKRFPHAGSGTSTDVERPLNHSESYTESKIESNGLLSFPTTARKRAKDDLKGFKTLLETKDDKGKERLALRAEGLGLDPAALIKTCHQHKAKNIPAYFTSLCVQRIATSLPGIDEQIIRSALWDKDDEPYTQLQRLLVGVP